MKMPGRLLSRADAHPTQAMCYLVTVTMSPQPSDEGSSAADTVCVTPFHCAIVEPCTFPGGNGARHDQLVLPPTTYSTEKRRLSPALICRVYVIDFAEDTSARFASQPSANPPEDVYSPESEIRLAVALLGVDQVSVSVLLAPVPVSVPEESLPVSGDVSTLPVSSSSLLDPPPVVSKVPSLSALGPPHVVRSRSVRQYVSVAQLPRTVATLSNSLRSTSRTVRLQNPARRYVFHVSIGMAMPPDMRYTSLASSGDTSVPSRYTTELLSTG